jgi:hypothetical protein
MTKKLILALLAQSVAMSDSPCAPEMPVASGNSWFGVGVDMGAAFVHGSVSQNVTDTSDTSTSKDEQKQVLNGGLLYLAPEIKNVVMNPVDSFKSNTEALKLATPEGFASTTNDDNVGYIRLVPNTSVASYKNSKVAVDFGGVPFNMADSSKKSNSTSAGFVGQLSFHYMTKIPETMMAVGLHAGIGYNGARSSLKMPMQTVNTSAPYTQNIKTADVGYSKQGNAAAYTRQYMYAENFVAQGEGGIGDFILLDKEQATQVKVENKDSKEVDGQWVVTGDDKPPYVSYNSDSVNLYGQATTKDEDKRVPVLLDGENLGAFTQSKKNTDINSKVTISSGFMLQAGTRLGAMIGNVFPHIRVGWAAYQLKAQITNQTYLNSGVDKEKSYSTKYEGNAAAIGGNGLGLKIANAEVTKGNTEPHYLGEPGNASANPRIISSNNGTFAGKLSPDVGSDLSTGTFHSKYKWANALTLGAGIDWAYQNMTFGLYYQAAICQKVNFDNWKSDIVTGTSAVTSLSKADKPKEVAAEYNGIATRNSSGVATTAVDAKKTEGTSKVTYTTGKPETVSMSPVFNTVMLSVKYCFKAA